MVNTERLRDHSNDGVNKSMDFGTIGLPKINLSNLQEPTKELIKRNENKNDRIFSNCHMVNRSGYEHNIINHQ